LENLLLAFGSAFFGHLGEMELDNFADSLLQSSNCEQKQHKGILYLPVNID